MALQLVPPMDEEPWPTLGPEVCDFLEDRAVYGPGSLKGQPYVIDPEFRAIIYRAYEVYPRGHRFEGRRRFKRVRISVRKGLAKTEKEALFVLVDLHPEAPARWDGWDAYGRPVGRPVSDPYIAMLAHTKDQVEELAFGALSAIIGEGPDADLFDISLERIIRLDDWGRADGKAVPLAQAPGSRDGARTTLNAFDEPHRLFLPRHLAAHETMTANLPKRASEDPWSIYVGTAGEPGQGSIEENLKIEADQIERGEKQDPQLFSFYRWARDGFDLTTLEGRIEAVKDATGPAGEWGPGQFADIASQWDRPAADKNYLERVWLNRWTRSNEQAFDMNRWEQLASEQEPGSELPTLELIKPGAQVTLGFDGARHRDATALVMTEVATGLQRLWSLWECPEGQEGIWEVPEAEVNDAVDEAFRLYDVALMLGDPPYWVDNMARWSGKHRGKVREFWTGGGGSERRTALAVKAYKEALDTGALRHEKGRNPSDEAAFTRHIGNAGRRRTQIPDPDRDGQSLELLKKIHEKRKFDAAMAAVLSWQARIEVLRKGIDPTKPKSKTFRKVR